MASRRSSWCGLLALALPVGALAAPPFPLPVPPGPATGIEATPEEVSFEAEVGGFDYQTVTVTTFRQTVLEHPAHLEDGTWFFDTQNGSCWQDYLVHGDPIPARTSCTIEIGFNPDAVFADYMDVLFVYACLSWHTGDSGQLVCDATGAFDTVTLYGVGTEPAGPPDLVVDGITFTTVPLPYSWQVGIRNAGGGSVDINGVVVQGYYSADTVIDGLDGGACGNTVTSAPLLGPGERYNFTVGCSGAPGVGDNYLIADIDITNAVSETDETNNTGFVALP